MDSSQKYNKFNVSSAGKTPMPKRTAHQLFRETEEDEPVFTKSKRKVVCKERPIVIEETEDPNQSFRQENETHPSPFTKSARNFYAQRVNQSLYELEEYFGAAALWPARLQELLLDSKSLSDFNCWVLTCFAYACEVPVEILTGYLKITKKFQKKGDFGFNSNDEGAAVIEDNYQTIADDKILKNSKDGFRVSELEYFVFDPLYRRLIFVHNRRPTADKYPETSTWGKYSYGKYKKTESTDKMY